MKILYLSKRAYTNKDLLDDRFGRVYEFSRALVREGHSVHGVALDYRRGRPDAALWEPGASDPDWRPYSLFPRPLHGLYRYLQAIRRLASELSPDVVVSVSDVYHVILGDWLSRQARCTHVTDLYDNYECFGAARLPGVRRLYRRALSRANGITAVSNSLKEHVLATARPACEPQVILNAVDRELFRPVDKSACRRQFDLPQDGVLVGLGGTISRFRGAHTLLEAHKKVLATGRDVHLVLAGAVTGGMDIPCGERVHYLGELAYGDMSRFYNALDAGIIINSDSIFAQCCFPQKFFEMRACGLPVIVAAIGDVKEFMGQCPGGLYKPGDVDDLAQAIARQVTERCMADVDVPDWDQQGKQFTAVLQGIHAARV